MWRNIDVQADWRRKISCAGGLKKKNFKDDIASSREAILALIFVDDTFASEENYEAVPASQETVPASNNVDPKDDTQRDVFK